MAKFSAEDYIAFVDRIIDKGMKLAAEHGREYDVMGAARLLWEARSFVQRALRKKIRGPRGLDLTVDLIRDVAAAQTIGAKATIAEMRRIAKRQRFRMRPAVDFPVPTILREERRLTIAAADAANRDRTFPEQVDDALARGLATTAERERRSGFRGSYDIVFFTRTLWRAQPFLEHALAADTSTMLGRELHVMRQDFLLAVYAGKRDLVKRMLADMVQIGQPGGFAPHPDDGREFPLPKLMLN